MIYFHFFFLEKQLNNVTKLFYIVARSLVAKGTLPCKIKVGHVLSFLLVSQMLWAFP